MPPLIVSNREVLPTPMQYSQHGDKDEVFLKSLMNFGKLTINTTFYVKTFGLIAVM